MSDKGQEAILRVLNEALSFVSSLSVTQNITNQSTAQFIDEELRRIEGSPEDKSARRNTRIGQIATIRKIKEDLNNVADAIIANPEILQLSSKPDLRRG